MRVPILHAENEGLMHRFTAAPGVLAALLLLVLGAAPVPAAAQPAYQHLRIIAPAAPGGGWDQTARAMQQTLQQTGVARIVKVVNIAGESRVDDIDRRLLSLLRRDARLSARALGREIDIPCSVWRPTSTRIA